MRSMTMNRGLLLALTLGVSVLTGCAMQTASGDPSSTGEESAAGHEGTAAASAADTAPLADTNDPAAAGQARETELNGGARVPISNPQAVRSTGACPAPAAATSTTRSRSPWQQPVKPTTN